jgi:hypothetical protein
MILAHQGGWDEMLLVAGPIIVVVALLRMAERRARRNRAQHGPDSSDPNSNHPNSHDTAPNEIS